MIQTRPGRKIFFTDIDDTLVNTDKSLSDENRAALDRYLEMDHILVISTGRALEGASNLMKDLGLYGRQNLLISSYNGGLIFDTFREEILFQRSIPMDLITESFALCRAHHVHIQAYTGSKVVSESDNHHIRKYLSIQKLGFLLVDDIRTSGIGSSPKLLCLDYDDPERLTAFRHVFESEMSEKLDCFNSNPNLLEIVPKGVNKGAALRMVADHYGVPVENTISAGDAENDLPMIIAAGIGCAMINGSESLKQAADYVTTRDNNHGGVAEILNRFCF